MSTEKQKALQRERTKRYRSKQNVTEKCDIVTLSLQTVTDSPKNVTPTLDSGSETGIVIEKHGETLSEEAVTDVYEQGADSLDTFHERFIDGGGKDNCLARATSNQLYSAINSYPQDTWKDSPEFKELMKRLHDG